MSGREEATLVAGATGFISGIRHVLDYARSTEIAHSKIGGPTHERLGGQTRREFLSVSGKKPVEPSHFTSPAMKPKERILLGESGG
jgi:hypothetical protein